MHPLSEKGFLAKPMMNAFYLRCSQILLVALVITLTGCSGTRGPSPFGSFGAHPTINHHAEAKKFLELAKKAEGPQATVYRLKAIDHLLLADATEQAESMLKEMSAPGPAQREHSYFTVVKAQLALNQRNVAQAEKIIQTIWTARQLDLDERMRYYEVLANVYEKQGKTLEAVQARINLDRLLNSGFQQQDNRQQIWNTLSQLTPEALHAMQHVSSEDQMSGWIAFAHLNKQYDTSPEEMGRALKVWKTRYPNHPATTLIRTDISRLGEGYQNQPKRIALLLPLQGRYAPTAKAIRDGFLTAYYERAKTSYAPPQVEVVDTTKYANTRDAYQAALSAKADFIVGPLPKEAVQEIYKMGRLQVPVLALNTLPESSGRPVYNFYQFGLPPEMEASLAAQKAWQDGHRRALVIVPKNEWGQRMQSAFYRAWTLRGGQVIDSQSFSKSTELNDRIRRLLAVREHKQAPKNPGGRANVEVSRRHDADFVFMAALPMFARQIKPLLDFYYAHDLPVYATSSIYDGHPAPRTDQDLNGVRFCDMPWVLDSSIQSRKIYRTIQQLWPDQLEHYPRLYALGIDAYQISQQLHQLTAFPEFSVSGMTGLLKVNSRNEIERQLNWSIIQNGAPVPLARHG